MVASVGRYVADLAARVFGAETLTVDEPWRSAWTPGDMARLLTRHGFVVDKDVNLLDVAVELGSSSQHAKSVRSGRVATGTRRI